jgi:hypothetical protein
MVVPGDGCPWNDGEGLPAEAPNTREMAGPGVSLGKVNQRARSIIPARFLGRWRNEGSDSRKSLFASSGQSNHTVYLNRPD